MKPSKTVVWLSWLTAVLAAFAAGVGLFLEGGEGPLTSITLRGQSVEMYGEGLYRYDSRFTGAGNKGTWFPPKNLPSAMHWSSTDISLDASCLVSRAVIVRQSL